MARSWRYWRGGSTRLVDKRKFIKGMVHLTQDMASDDDFGPPNGQTAILCKKNTKKTCKVHTFVCAKFSPVRAVLYLQLNRALL